MSDFKLVTIENWDIMAIVYSVIASAVFFFILKWFGLYKLLRKKIQNRKALSNYRKTIIEDCNTLIVVGKRKGFSLNQVYIDLDIAQSDLMSYDEKLKTPPNSFVLVGGPGAGKSTTAKNIVLKQLPLSNSYVQPFYVKLKDYSGSETIEQFLIHKLESSGFTDTKDLIKKCLSNKSALCILDGLDEVRPNLRNKICIEINKFYSDYFRNGGRLIITCRKEAYRDIPLDMSSIWEVRPLSDEQIKRFASKWPLDYPKGKTKETFFRDLVTTPRILELARSPLLLVGGLMHYTEANLGVPEQRFEYLKTMAKWLIIDWAKAQGHAPDKYRNVYERLLSRLAYYMHDNEFSEISIEDANKFVSTLLPDYGYLKEESDIILNSITVKTGILIKDGNTLFFAQFGMQEYFVSIELFNQIAIDDITKLSPPTWWREPILLNIAQQQEPSIILNLLFESEPLLAIAAVAECPTPSIEIQNKAVTVCLTYIDKKDKAVKGSLIPLLRKTRDNIEIRLCSELEKRLSLDEELSSLVGLSLANAGTQIATNTLAKHPEVWDVCLKQTGFLSSSFEDLLINWIQDGDDYYSSIAADLISKRLSNDRLIQLLELIPSLSKKKKDYLSRLILRDLANSSYGALIGAKGSMNKIEIISSLVPNINDPKSLIKDILPKKSKNHNEFFHPFSQSIVPSIIIAFYLGRNQKRCTSKEILDNFIKSSLWASNRKSIFFWIVSSIIVLGISFDQTIVRVSILALIASTSYILYQFGPITSSYFPETFYYSRARLSNVFLLYMLGALSFLILGGIYHFVSIYNSYEIGIAGSAVIFSLLGIIFWNNGRVLPFGFSFLSNVKNTLFGFTFPYNFNFLFLLWVLFIGFHHIFAGKSPLVYIINAIVSIVYLVWLLSNTIRIIIHWRLFKKADNQLKKELNINTFDIPFIE